jgi:hypothetical protein
MRGQEILKGLVGRNLTDGQVKSLYINGEPLNLINVSFLKFDKDWIRIVCTDEQTDIQFENEDLNKFDLKTEDGAEFSVTPIGQLFPDFNKYLNKRLLGFKELVLNKSEFMSFGLSLKFEGGLIFTIRNYNYPVDKNEYLFEKVDFDDLREK